MTRLSIITALAALAFGPVAAAQTTAHRHGQAPTTANASDWRETEAETLTNHVQLTFGSQYVRAGESYFSPDDSKVVFQAVEAKDDGSAADEFYAMFVADVVRDSTGRITGLANHTRISPPRSANTCGWFHPTKPNIVLFASTIVPPTESTPPGYQRASGRYRWMFPPEMRLVWIDLEKVDGTAATVNHVLENPAEAYHAECSFTRDGRHLLYCSLETKQGDLYVKDLETDRITPLVEAHGYDGGPFFSPDDKRLCYRSDRQGNNLLQIYIAELEYDATGAIVGVEREFQITDNQHVNWCPFWHPDGRHLLYATSEVSHRNYEVFVIDADPGDLDGSNGSVKYGTRKRRVTFADGADVLPAFTSDGKTMIWTSKRGATATSQLWVADFVMDLDPKATPSAYDPSKHRKK